MKAVTLSAYFDGKQIVLEEPHELKPKARLLVTVLPESDGERPGFFESDWHELSLAGLGAAYGPDEPEYPDSVVEEPNADYGKR